MRLRNSVSGLSAVDVLRADLDGGECGCTICSCKSVKLEDFSKLERLRSVKHDGTLSIFGNGETGVEETW